jgi:hypothetical protein
MTKRKTSKGTTLQAASPAEPANAVEQAPISQRASVDIEALRDFLDSIGSFAGPELILESSSVNRLYHYTDLAGLNGIEACLKRVSETLSTDISAHRHPTFDDA